MELVRGLRIDIDDTTSRTAWDIRSACRRLKGDGGLDLVVVDYVQLMPGSLERRGSSRNEEVTDISRRLKALADELGVPLLVLSQLSRAADGRADPRPKLSDLRESGSLEQDADLVCFLHRKHHKEGGPTEFILDKQRNGPTGTIMLTLDRDITLFTNGGEPLPAPTPAEKQAERKVRQLSFIKQRRAHSR
jgi:replicative DNA helicase